MFWQYLSIFMYLTVVSCNTVNVTFSQSDLTQPAVWLSAATYCSIDDYLTRTYNGPTKGFVPTYVIYDKRTDTQGYIGYLPSEKTIFVVFRGSISPKNWLTDLDFKKTSYDSFPECNCEVHEGFYKAVQAVIGGITKEVESLQSLLHGQGYRVMVSGHSLGAALSHITGMELSKAGIDCSVTNFGMPRVGTMEYATFAETKISTLRYTHFKDIVPHIPPQKEFNFHHVCTEMYEDESGRVKQCKDPSCEDPSCADQFPVTDTNWDDHSVYVGVHLSCDAVSN